MAREVQSTLDLNDWLNTVSEHSIFRDFEGTEQFREIIDELLDGIEVLTAEQLQDMRQLHP